MRSPPTPAFHILLAVSDSERHGYAIMQDIRARTGGALRLGPGTLYGTIKRLLADGLIEETGERAERDSHDVRRRYYRITRRGRKVAAEEAARPGGAVRPGRGVGFAPKAV